METLLNVNHLSGSYGNRQVLHDISFDVKPNEIVGLIGLNGAGKSTTIRHILGLMEPTAGEITINQQTIQTAPDTYRQQFAFIPETPMLYDELTLWEHLKVTAMAYGLDDATFEARAEKLLTLFRMTKMKKWFPSEFSKGMRQKVMIMAAFLVEPSLYIVDEPFVGLDPLAIQSFLEWMIEAKNNGAGVLMSTHILSTAEKYCDRFIILHNGEIATSGTMKELRRAYDMPTASLDDIYVKVAREGV